MLEEVQIKCSSKRLLYLGIPVGVHKCNMHLAEQKSQLLLRWADRTAYI